MPNPQILVPYSTNRITEPFDPFELYSVQSSESNRVQGRWVPYDQREPKERDNKDRTKKKLDALQLIFKQEEIGREFQLIREKTNNANAVIHDGTPSVFLGLYLTLLQEVRGIKYNSKWKSITVTGDIKIIDRNIKLAGVGDIEKKYEDFTKEIENYSQNKQDKHLFIYVSDKKYDNIKSVDNIYIEYFSANDTINNIITYISGYLDEKKHSVFISHSMNDVKKADKVCFFLESNGVNCWRAPRNINPGSSYPVQILEAIRNCHIFLLLASENTNLSEHVSSEIERAFEYKKLIIPFMLQDIKFSDEQLYFLARRQRIEAYNDIEIGLGSLLSTVLSVIQKSKHSSEDNNIGNTAQYTAVKDESPKKNNKFKLISGVDVTEKDLSEALLLDSIVYEEFDAHFTLEKCLQWHEINPLIYFILKDENLDSVIGYVNIAPVTESCYNKILSGEIWDTAIEEDSVLPYDLPGLYYLNFTSIAVNPSFRGPGVIMQLIDAIISNIITLSEHGIYFKAMVADAVTPAGEKICRMVGMDLLKETNRGTKIYAVSFFPPIFRKNSKLLKELAEIYEKVDITDMTAF